MKSIYIIDFIAIAVITILKISLFKLYIKYYNKNNYNPNIENIFFIILLTFYFGTIKGIIHGNSIGIINILDFIALFIIVLIRKLFLKLYIKVSYHPFYDEIYFLVMLLIYFGFIKEIIR